MGITIRAEKLTKRFAGRDVFRDLSFSAEPGKITAIVGPNGSGKSTLLKILAQVLTQSAGKCEWLQRGEVVKSEHPERLRGFVAPYLELYDDLTAVEHIEFVAKLKGVPVTHEEAVNELVQFGLANESIEQKKLLRFFSSGMKQRVRFAIASMGSPELLFLDESTSNLDAIGIDLLFGYLQSRRSNASIVLATNEPREREIADAIITLT
jgi:heme exporter protein A